MVYCQYGSDVNRDHGLVFKALVVATRPSEAITKSVNAFDTASSNEWAYLRSFVPDTCVDISSPLEAKLNAMACYQTELRPYPHLRSMGALRFRTHRWGNQACMDAAQVFVTVRKVYCERHLPF